LLASAQEDYPLKEGNYSIFTYYLHQGLKRTEKSIDAYGNITPYSLASYTRLLNNVDYLNNHYYLDKELLLFDP
jgi:hypothetical protein